MEVIKYILIQLPANMPAWWPKDWAPATHVEFLAPGKCHVTTAVSSGVGCPSSFLTLWSPTTLRFLYLLVVNLPRTCFYQLIIWSWLKNFSSGKISLMFCSFVFVNFVPLEIAYRLMHFILKELLCWHRNRHVSTNTLWGSLSDNMLDNRKV